MECGNFSTGNQSGSAIMINKKLGGNMKVKKFVPVLLVLILFMGMMSGCVPSDSSGSSDTESSITSSDNGTENDDPEDDPGSMPFDIANIATISTVYMTADISSKGLMAVYNALGRKATGKVAVKINTGEAGDTYYLHPNLIKGLVQSVKGTIVECNTAYGGSRANTAMHLQVAKDHGFTSIANVDIMDADSSTSLPVKNGMHLKEDLVGSHIKNYDSMIVLSHFKGHVMAGFGGAIKNMSIGIASSKGKLRIHGAGASITSIFSSSASQDDFLESMAEAAKAVADYEGNHIMYINVMNNLSVDCDCDSNPAAPTMKDIGILASLDPVALDQACVDFVYKAPDGKDLIERIDSRNGTHMLDHAQEIGLGSESYNLVQING